VQDERGKIAAESELGSSVSLTQSESGPVVVPAKNAPISSPRVSCAATLPVLDDSSMPVSAAPGAAATATMLLAPADVSTNSAISVANARLECLAAAMLPAPDASDNSAVSAPSSAAACFAAPA